MTTNKAKILLVEPSRIVAEGLCKILNDSGLFGTVSCIASVEHLVSYMTNVNPDVLIINPMLVPSEKLPDFVALRQRFPNVKNVAFCTQLADNAVMEKFSTQPLEPVTEIAQNPTDNDFLIRMNKIIEENFSNSDLNVDFLADRLNISRSGLFAKIKTLADVTPNEMIQIVRLKRAAQLLHDGGYLVSEVGYMVGFSNPSYFSKCFQKQFGIRPADYMKSKSAET